MLAWRKLSGKAKEKEKREARWQEWKKKIQLFSEGLTRIPSGMLTAWMI